MGTPGFTMAIFIDSLPTSTDITATGSGDKPSVRTCSRCGRPRQAGARTGLWGGTHAPAAPPRRPRTVGVAAHAGSAQGAAASPHRPARTCGG